jgi:hypothetical protein
MGYTLLLSSCICTGCEMVNKWNDSRREVHEMFKTANIDRLEQDKKCKPC